MLDRVLYLPLTSLPCRYLLVQSQQSKHQNMCEIFSKLSIKTPEPRHWLFVNFEQISHTLFWCFLYWFWASKFRLSIFWKTPITFLTGYYAYLETSKRQRNLFATLYSPIYSGSFAQCDIVFWYHMYGNNVGVLKLDLVNFYPAVDTPQYTTLFELRGMENSNCLTH